MPAVLSIPLFDPAAVPSPRPCTLASPPRADAVKVGRRANHATMSDFARPHLGRWRARRQACMGRAEDDQTIGHRHVGAHNALYAKPTMCARMHRSQFLSGLLYNVGEWERERPSHAVTAAPSNCVNGLTSIGLDPLKNALPAPDQGHADLSANRQPTRRATAARAHQDREHCPLPRRRD
jgi:hypothetical protein